MTIPITYIVKDIERYRRERSANRSALLHTDDSFDDLLDRPSFARQRCAVTHAPRLLRECVALDLTSFRSDSADGGRTLGRVPTVRDTPVDGSLCTLDDQILSTLTFPPSCSDDEVGEPVGGDDTPQRLRSGCGEPNSRTRTDIRNH